jgi:hypothetical protein
MTRGPDLALDEASLLDLLADPAKLRALSDAALVDVVRAVEHWHVEVHAETLRRTLTPPALPAPPPPPTDDERPFTTADLATRWNKPRAYVADLCRSGRLPGAIRKQKSWLIPRRAEADWFATPEGLDAARSVTLHSDHDDSSHRETRAPDPRAVTVRVRQAPRRPPGHRSEVGGGHATPEHRDRDADQAARRDAPPTP